jgi:hypothetical protein
MRWRTTGSCAYRCRWRSANTLWAYTQCNDTVYKREVALTVSQTWISCTHPVRNFEIDIVREMRKQCIEADAPGTAGMMGDWWILTLVLSMNIASPASGWSSSIASDSAWYLPHRNHTQHGKPMHSGHVFSIMLDMLYTHHTLWQG